MRKPVLLLSMVLALHGPLLAQPWLECAEKYLPAVVETESREAYRSSLVHGYARNGQFARAQALIDGVTDDKKQGLGVMAAVGALRGDHVDQALRWAKLYLPPTEISWDQPAHLSHGSDRERFLRSPRSPEAARRVLEFMRANGGVSTNSMVFVLREIGGMPMSVSDYYFREFAKMSDLAGPVEWIQIEESLEASGEEFDKLGQRVLEVLLEQREQLVTELAAATATPRADVDAGMKKYAAILLARHGRFDEAEQLWRTAAPASPDEQKLFLQNQYLGGRKKEALAALTELSGMEEDARVQLALFLFGLGHFEEMKELGTDPIDYIDMRIAKRDLERGLSVDRWLAFAAKLDSALKPVDSVLFNFAHDFDMPPEVRQKAKSLLPDLSANTALAQAALLESVERLKAEESARMTLMLLLLDEDVQEAGVAPDQQALQIIGQLNRNAPIVTTPGE